LQWVHKHSSAIYLVLGLWLVSAVIAYTDEYTITADPADLAYAAAQDPNEPKPTPEAMLQAYVDAWLAGQRQKRLEAEERAIIEAGRECLAAGKTFSAEVDQVTGKIVGVCL